MKIIVPFVHILLGILCLTLLPTAQAVVPSPDGGYPGGNTAEGQSALFSRTTGGFNTAVGWFSLKSDTDGSYNTAVGAGALVLNNGPENTAVGTAALLLNTTGDSNTATGAFALFSNTTGNDNTAIGIDALSDNTEGARNTAIGSSALSSNTTATDNTAIGSSALFSNTTAPGNTAVGVAALFSNTTGANNTAIGVSALEANTTGEFNTALGREAGRDITTGNNNTAVGLFALASNTTGSNNIALGEAAGGTITTGSNNIDIGHPGNAADSDTIRIGQTQTRTFIGGIFGQTTAGAAIPVVIDEAAQLGTVSSSRRFKKEIQPMAKASEALLGLKPVTFHYKSDNTNTPQFGLIAEEVAEVNPDLVVHDEDGDIYTVRYDAVNAMLLNEFLKEHRKVEEQQVTIAKQRKDFKAAITQLNKQMETVVARLKEHDAKIQKVSEELYLRNPGVRTVANDQ